MRIFVNCKVRHSPHGGANNFLRTLLAALTARGIAVTNDIHAQYDVALINALTEEIRIADLAMIHNRGIPIVHRKTGYVVSGSPEMRARVNGVVVGNQKQLDFEPYVTSSIFQSSYSFYVFQKEGYAGNQYSIIHNGVDSRIFGLYDFPLHRLRFPRRRQDWDGNEPFRFAIVTWSRDWRKGFPFFQELDNVLPHIENVRVDLVGRVPLDLHFRNIHVHRPTRAKQISRFLRSCHGYLAFSEEETCSNALLEAINCGLHVLYLDSGSNTELAEKFGVVFSGNFQADIKELVTTYAARAACLQAHPYDIAPVAEKYIDVLRQAIAGATKRTAQVG